VSRAPSTSMLDIQARVADVAATLGGIPDAVAAALHEAMFDLVNHHRRSVLKHHGLPSKRRAQKMLAAQLHRYTKRGMERANPIEMSAESFGASSTPKFLLNLEYGGPIRSDDWMAIPVEGGLFMNKSGERMTHANFRKFLTSNKLRAVSTRRGILLVKEQSRSKTKTGEIKGARTVVYGVLRKSRTQRPMLGFNHAWEKNLPEQLAKFDKILDEAVTEAGRIRLARQQEASRASTAAYYDELERQLAASGGKMNAAVRRAATEAAKAAKARSLARKEGGS